MYAKKNPENDLNRKSSLFFQIGLIIVLFFTYVSFEWKTTQDNSENTGVRWSDPSIEPEIPLIEIQKPEPLVERPKQPEKIDIEENQKELIESQIMSQDINSDTRIPDIIDIPVEKIIETVDYVNVEQIPLFPGCEKVDKNLQRACFQEKMTAHVRNNFKYPEEAIGLEIQGRVFIQFVIDKEGNITDLKLRGPDKRLELEAKRIISKLPKMIPGRQGGKTVKVPYSLPINFVLQK